MHWQVKTEEVFVDDPFLDHDLVEVSHHVVNSSKIDHLHVKTNWFGNIDNLDVHCVRPPQEWSFPLFISVSDQI